MASQPEVVTQIRFALAQLPVDNGQFTFEQICRQLAQQFICTNILPATGPVSAHGDGGRDFETFRTYLKNELGPHGAFLALVSDGPLAFTCTIQSTGIERKIRDDVAKIMSSGQPVAGIHSFVTATVPVGKRQQVEEAILADNAVPLQIYDGEAVADLIARQEAFWIAEQYLRLPSAIAPELTSPQSGMAEWYEGLRAKWRGRDTHPSTYGDLIDLRPGLREATFRMAARPDLPFWIGLVRELLASENLEDRLGQRARYELILATLRGTGTLRPVDSVAATYMSQSLTSSDPAELRDASVMLEYINGAAQRRVTEIEPAQIRSWRLALVKRARSLADDETPNRRASLLFTLGHLGSHPDIDALALPEEPGEIPDPIDWDITQPALSFGGDLQFAYRHFSDLELTMDAWGELAHGLEQTPLFPVDELASQIEFLTPLLIELPGWRELVDLVDASVERVAGRSAVAERAHARARSLLKAGRRLDALSELHQAKLDWWSGETVRGALLCMLTIADIYLDLKLPMAAKAYSLAVAHAALSRDDEVADLVPVGLIGAAEADMLAGAWCGAAQLYAVGLMAHHDAIEGGLDLDKHPLLLDSVRNLVLIRRWANDLAPVLVGSVERILERLGLADLANAVFDDSELSQGTAWSTAFASELMGSPWSDLGRSRRIEFSALGLNWIIAADNTPQTARAAERFAAAAQALCVELAAEDLCLMPTNVEVRLALRQQADNEVPTHFVASNDGRVWDVKLSPVPDPPPFNVESLHMELLACLLHILLDVSLRPTSKFLEIVERAFKRGLFHKLAPPRSYDELASVISDDAFLEFRRDVERPSTPMTIEVHSDIQWQDGPGPTYSQDRAQQFLHNRYTTFNKSLQYTIPRLMESAEFRVCLRQLRDRGWLDWHILTAIANVVLNYRHRATVSDIQSPEFRESILQEVFAREDPNAESVPVGLFTTAAMEDARQIAMLSLARHWGLEVHQETPDFFALERLLAARYGYWDDDLPHDDPFIGGKVRGTIV